jgi:predicted nucleotidyltransferase
MWTAFHNTILAHPFSHSRKFITLLGNSKYCIIISMDEKTVRTIVRKCKDVLANNYGARLKGVILYGSAARGEAAPASDIDLLVLLSPPLDYFAELRRIVDLLYPIQLESEQLISAKPALASDYEMGSISLYRNARREGIAV